MKKYFRRCGKVKKETYVTSDYGNPTLMLLTFDSAFASTATAGKGFNLTVSSVGEGNDSLFIESLRKVRQLENMVLPKLMRLAWINRECNSF